MRRSLSAVLLLFITVEVHAASEGRIRALNVGAQAVMTLVSGLVQGKVKGLADVGNCLGSGAVGGYGAFESKILISNGHVGNGWLLANLSASLSENAAAGKLPWKQAGYSIGPLRLRVSFDRRDDAYAYVDASVYETTNLIQAHRRNDKLHFQSGMIVFEKRQPYESSSRTRPYQGETWGIYPGVWTLADPDLRPHETIHAVQSLQGDAVEPSFELLTLHPQPAARRRWIRFDHLKLGLVNSLSATALGRQNYERRWTEIEAYRLAEDDVPKR